MFFTPVWRHVFCSFYACGVVKLWVFFLPVWRGAHPCGINPNSLVLFRFCSNFYLVLHWHLTFFFLWFSHLIVCLPTPLHCEVCPANNNNKKWNKRKSRKRKRAKGKSFVEIRLPDSDSRLSCIPWVNSDNFAVWRWHCFASFSFGSCLVYLVYGLRVFSNFD